jgi:transcriptional regulator with XRE-family HTH domain
LLDSAIHAILFLVAQKPAKRHVLANARIEVGLSQVELADLLGCSTASVQRIEQGTLGLSEELALKVQEALEENEVKQEELSEDIAAREIYARYRAMLKKARGSPKRTILRYRVAKAFQELEKDFPPDKESFEELNRLGYEKALAEYEPQAIGLGHIARMKPSKPKK